MSEAATDAGRARLAVLIPTHNRPETLGRALASVWAQTVLPDEVIVVDDASDVPVSNAIFAGVPDGVRTLVLRNDVPLGANGARNRGLKEASSDYVAFLDDDDEFMAGKVAALHGALGEGGHDVAYHAARMVYDNENVVYDTRVKSEVGFDDLLVGNAVGGTPVGCIGRAFALDIGGFDTQLPALQDWDLWLRAARAGARFRAIAETLTLCHVTTDTPGISMSIDNIERALEMIDAKFAADLARLTPEQKRKRERTDAVRLAYRHALTGRRFEAAKAFVRGGIGARSPSLFAAAGVSLLGIKYLAMARQRGG